MKQINIFEVGPRDGFQNLPDYVPAETKLQIIDGLVDAGVKHMQITSFVSPKAIPQMQDAVQITEHCLREYPALDLFALVPNLRGAQSAWEAGLRKAAYVVSLSASHNKANINRTHQQSLEELQKIKEAYPQMEIVVDLATAFGCPFEGKFTPSQVVDFLWRLQVVGVGTVNLCDTIGVANPKQMRETVNAVQQAFPKCNFQVHIHDTRGMGLANTLAAIEAGITDVQSTLGGLGGCPFAPGASGNTASEDLVFLLTEMGYDTGVDFQKLLTLAKWEHSKIKGSYSGHHLHIQSANCASA